MFIEQTAWRPLRAKGAEAAVSTLSRWAPRRERIFSICRFAAKSDASTTRSRRSLFRAENQSADEHRLCHHPRSQRGAFNTGAAPFTRAGMALIDPYLALDSSVMLVGLVGFGYTGYRASRGPAASACKERERSAAWPRRRAVFGLPAGCSASLESRGRKAGPNALMLGSSLAWGRSRRHPGSLAHSA
jgi:hypothetical protein